MVIDNNGYANTHVKTTQDFEDILNLPQPVRPERKVIRPYLEPNVRDFEDNSMVPNDPVFNSGYTPSEQNKQINPILRGARQLGVGVVSTVLGGAGGGLLGGLPGMMAGAAGGSAGGQTINRVWDALEEGKEWNEYINEGKEIKSVMASAAIDGITTPVGGGVARLLGGGLVRRVVTELGVDAAFNVGSNYAASKIEGQDYTGWNLATDIGTGVGLGAVAKGLNIKFGKQPVEAVDNSPINQKPVNPGNNTESSFRSIEPTQLRLPAPKTPLQLNGYVEPNFTTQPGGTKQLMPANDYGAYDNTPKQIGTAPEALQLNAPNLKDYPVTHVADSEGNISEVYSPFTQQYLDHQRFVLGTDREFRQAHQNQNVPPSGRSVEQQAELAVKLGKSEPDMVVVPTDQLKKAKVAQDAAIKKRKLELADQHVKEIDAMPEPTPDVKGKKKPKRKATDEQSIAELEAKQAKDAEIKKMEEDRVRIESELRIREAENALAYDSKVMNQSEFYNNNPAAHNSVKLDDQRIFQFKNDLKVINSHNSAIKAGKDLQQLNFAETLKTDAEKIAHIEGTAGLLKKDFNALRSANPTEPVANTLARLKEMRTNSVNRFGTYAMDNSKTKPTPADLHALDVIKEDLDDIGRLSKIDSNKFKNIANILNSADPETNAFNSRYIEQVINTQIHATKSPELINAKYDFRAVKKLLSNAYQTHHMLDFQMADGSKISSYLQSNFGDVLDVKVNGNMVEVSIKGYSPDAPKININNSTLPKRVPIKITEMALADLKNESLKTDADPKYVEAMSKYHELLRAGLEGEKVDDVEFRTSQAQATGLAITKLQDKVSKASGEFDGVLPNIVPMEDAIVKGVRENTVRNLKKEKLAANSNENSLLLQAYREVQADKAASIENTPEFIARFNEVTKGEYDPNFDRAFAIKQLESSVHGRGITNKTSNLELKKRLDDMYAPDSIAEQSAVAKRYAQLVNENTKMLLGNPNVIKDEISLRNTVNCD